MFLFYYNHKHLYKRPMVTLEELFRSTAQFVDTTAVVQFTNLTLREDWKEKNL